MSRQTLNLAQTAALLKLSTARVHQLCNMGLIERNPDKSIDLIKAVHGYIDFLRKNSVENSAKSDMTATEAKGRRLIAQAKLTELELRLREGEVVQVVDVLPQWERMVQAFKFKMLAIPTKAAPMILGKNDLPVISDTLTDMIVEALNELAKGEDVKIIEEAEPEFSEDGEGDTRLSESSTTDGD